VVVVLDEVIFIHCADIHLDARFTGTGFSGTKTKQRRQEIRDAFSRIIDEVIQQKAQLLFISGDLYEHDYVSKNTIDFVIKQLQRIPDVRVFIAPGNHDPYVGNSYYAIAEWPENTHIFGGTLEYISIPEYGINIYGVGFTNKYHYESLLNNRLVLLDNSQANILVTHGTVDDFSENCPYHPISSQEITDNGFDYAALGHIHKHTSFRDKIVYCGSPEPLGFDEAGKHGIVKGIVTGKVIKTEFIPLNKRECISKQIDITNVESIEELEVILKGELAGHKENLLKLTINGRKANRYSLDIDLLTSRLEDLCFYLKIIDDSLPYCDLEELSKENSLKGIFVRKLLDEISKTSDEKIRDKLYQALYLGMDALDNRELKI